MTAGTTFSAVAAMDEEGLDREALSLKLKLLLEVGLAQWHANEELERESVEAMDGVGGVRRSHFCLIFLLWGENKRATRFLQNHIRILFTFGAGRARFDARDFLMIEQYIKR